MTEQEEELLHLAICIQNLNSSWRILHELKDKKLSPILVNAAFQFALIEYSKPYTASFGKVLNKKGNNKRYILDTKYIPQEYLELHERILNARKTIHAHSDLTLLDAAVHVREDNYGKSVNYSSKIIYGTEEFQNIQAIISLIEKTLDILYKEEEYLKQNLEIN